MIHRVQRYSSVYISRILLLAFAACLVTPRTGAALEIYVSDWYASYSIVTDAGGLTSSVPIDVGLVNPHGIEIGPGGNLYISHGGGVEVFQTDGTPVATPSAPLFNNSLHGALAIDVAGNTYFANRFSQSVSKYAPDGTSLYHIPMPEVATGVYQGIFDLAIDNEGFLQVVARDGFLHKYDAVGNHVSSIEVADSASGVAVDSQNNVYVSGNIGGPGADSGAWKVTPAGTVTKFYDTSIDIAGIDFNRNDELYAAVASHVEKVDATGTWQDQIVTGHAFGHFLSVEEEPIPVDTNSNLSFDSVHNFNNLELDLGIVPMTGSSFASERLAYSIHNLASGGVGSSRLTSVVATGDTDVLSTDVDTFIRGLEDGHAAQFAGLLDTTLPGVFRSSYELTFTDDFGGTEVLNVNLRGVVQPPANDPAVPDLVYNAHTGEVTIEPAAGGSIIGYTLGSDDAFLSGNHTPVLSGVVTSLPGELAEATLSGISTAASIGNVLPAGLTLGDVYDIFTERTVSTALGVPLVDFDIGYYLCAVGDADCDSDVDLSGDILPAFSNFTGPGSFGMSRADGDVGPHPAGDGDVDIDDILLMFGNFSGPLDEVGGLGTGSSLSAPAEAGDSNIPDLIYDPATGEVVLDPDGSGIIGYSLKNLSNSFLAGNHTPILGGVTTSLASELAEAALSSPGSAMSIGFVLPTGLDLASLTGLLSTNEVSRSLGAPIVPFDLVVLGPAVPEPATLVLSAFGLVGIGFIARRRRTHPITNAATRARLSDS